MYTQIKKTTNPPKNKNKQKKTTLMPEVKLLVLCQRKTEDGDVSTYIFDMEKEVF